MKDDSLYIVAIVAVVAVVGLVIMATGSSTTVVAQESLPDMVESDSSAIAGQAINSKGLTDLHKKQLDDLEDGGISGVGGKGKTDDSDDDTSKNDDPKEETTTSVHEGNCPPGRLC